MPSPATLEDKDLRSVQEVRRKVALAYEASLEFRKFSQEQVDAIVDRAAAAARENSERLARLAVEETGYGNVRDKTIKNLLNCDVLHRAIRPLKTVGVIGEDHDRGILEIAEPVGVVAAILPTTNPTSTALFKILIALKGRNAIVVSPHPRAVACTCEAASVLGEAAEEAGAPRGTVQCLSEATIEGTNALMRHQRTSLILSTGGTSIVRAAYSSGKPAVGVGPGNVVVLLERSADLDEAIAAVVEGKSFDYGTLCSSEQSVIAEEASREAVLAALEKQGAHLCDEAQSEALAKLLIEPSLRVNPDCVGQSPQRIAEMAGFRVPSGARVLVVELRGVGREHPLSAEKLSPVLGVLFVKDFSAGLAAAKSILNFGGRGHTCVIHSKDHDRIREFGLAMPAFRVLVNTPAPQGSTGITTNLSPSMTLGCGAMAGNITGDNVGPMHLVNIKRIAYKVRDVAAAFESDQARALFAGGEAGRGVSGQEQEQGPAPLVAPGPAAALALPIPQSSGAAGASKVTAAVQRYLSERRLAGGADRSAESAAGSSSPANGAASVVDRFVADRKPARVAAGVAARRGASRAVRSASAAPSPSARAAAYGSATSVPSSSAPGPEAVPFVCEDDVRRAMVKQTKIYINAKTIVTPAARDLDDGYKVLVRVE